MFEKIIHIDDQSATIRLAEDTSATINLMNLHIVFEDDYKTILGEVDNLDGDIVKVRFLGEIVDGKLLGGVIRKPSLDASVRVISEDEIPLIVGNDERGFMELGVSPFYNDYPVHIDVNSFFSNHFAIFGNSGSGKSCGVTRLFQNMFHDKRLFPYKANIFLFDESGEYYNAFKNLNTIDSNYNYRYISTNENDKNAERLRLPIFLLNATDLALLLQATNHSQLPIIERMLKLALIFSQNDLDSIKYKNHLIAKAIMTVLYTSETAPNKRNEIFSIINSCSTGEFNLESVLQGVGYTRKFRECFLIDNQGQFSESVLLTEYVSSFINPEYDNYEPEGGVFYTLDTLEKALNFALISEGWLRNKNTYADAITLKVRLHALIVGSNSKFFQYDDYVSLETYLSSLLINDGKKYQIININFDDVDDSFAKVITKIYSRMVFEFAKSLPDRASIPFHLVIEEAHRYIQNDTDRFLIGYNIFERIAKEGRKYGVMLGLISQRPVELSDTVISQCSNFMIFKMNHPVDVEYIRKMVPNISDEIIEKQKSLQSGTCLGFGTAFRIPLIIKMKMPDPVPWSGNSDVVRIWNGKGDDAALGFANKSKAAEEKKDETKEKTMMNNCFNNRNMVINRAQTNPFGNSKMGGSRENSSAIIEIPKIPTAIQQNPNNGDGYIRPYMPTSNGGVNNYAFSSNFGADNISNGMNLTDNLLNTMTGGNSNVSTNVGGFNMNNINLQSAIPDFAMTSAQERELGAPTNSFSIPSALDIAANQSAVRPTVSVEKTDDFGKVTIAPPDGASDVMSSSFGFSNQNGGSNGKNGISAGSGMPTTSSGKPLINLVG